MIKSIFCFLLILLIRLNLLLMRAKEGKLSVQILKVSIDNILQFIQFCLILSLVT